jgi:spore coat protein U-like protein
MMFKKTLIATALLAFGGFAMTASAATQVSTFNVTATVINDCIISSTNIAFGNYDPTVATAVTAQGAITAKCTLGDVVSVGLNQGLTPGTGSSAAVPVRQMINGANNLPYHIYTTSGGTTEWGVGTVGTNEPAAQTSLSVLIPLTFTTYGSLPAGTNVPAGSYSDTVIATVTY